MKSYTDIEQSKKLVEILPLESADMCYIAHSELISIHEPFYKKIDKEDTPCWSLAALLSVLPISIDEEQHCLALINSNPNDIEWLCCYEDYKGDLMMECYAGNPVDACVDMIIKLKELNLL